MLSFGMFPLALRFLFTSLSLVAQQSGGDRLPTFPLPDKMFLIPSDNRFAIGNQALLKATGALPDAITSVRVFLGALGNGAIVSGQNHGSDNVCGATGNCPTSVYFLSHGRYREAVLDSGWAYGVVGTNKSIPDLVVMSNMSYKSGIASRFSFMHGTYVKAGCDYVELKDDTQNILDPAHIVIRDCNQR